MALNFLRPGAPRDQPLFDLPAAMSAIAVAILNAGVTSLSYHLLRCHGDGAKTMHAYYDVYYQGANLVTAMLGVALLGVGMAFPEAVVLRSPAVWHPVVKWIVWVTKVLTGVTLTYSFSVLHSCLRTYALTGLAMVFTTIFSLLW